MKKFILISLLLAGCAALQTPKKDVVKESPNTPTEVEVPQVIEEKPAPEISIPAPIAVEIPKIVNPTRYVLDYPKAYAAHVLRAQEFFRLAVVDPTVIDKNKFDYSDTTADSLRERIRKGFTVRVTTYRPSIWKGGKWSKVIGYHSGGTIYHNSYYVGRLNDCEIVNHLVHEASHTMGYSHGDNSPSGKNNSVPYWIGDRAEQLCKEGKI